jgi:hypothetical protein
MPSGVCNNAEMDISPPFVLQKCGNSSIAPLCFVKMRKLTYLLRHLQQCENEEINTCPAAFSIMRKWTDLSPLFFKNAEINASPPSVFQKCGN